MPWQSDENVFERRLKFVRMALDGRYRMTELCELFGVSRNNAYKWLKRYREEGAEGLRDRSRVAKSHPAAVPTEVISAILEERDAHPTWGAKKIRAILERDYPEMRLPARSTIHWILKRNGRVQAKRPRRTRHEHPGKPFVPMDLPNSVWSADYKGQFRLQQGRNCYPLTVADGHSRYLLGCDALSSTRFALAHKVFRRLFIEYGLPEAILTDNGSPFASTGLRGLTQLSVWWLRLGIKLIRTQPSHPEQNGRHERMHRTLKAEATMPAQYTFIQQQRAFDRFRLEYNEVRPHEALDMATPASFYSPSPRPYPARLPKVGYPPHFITRLVATTGYIRWHSDKVYVSKPLANQYVGLEEVDDGIWSVYFGTNLIGRLNDRNLTIR